MVAVVAGSRTYRNKRRVFEVLDQFAAAGLIDRVVSGCAAGPDSDAIEWAEMNGVPVDKHAADWDSYGNSAGFIRNAEMAAIGDILLAFWDGKSKGTKHMIDCMQRKNKKVWIFE
ncbi:MAG: DUF2493 domain-containing protein [Clostridia bacterium]|nr:DUF2493 domain-containing protein [Clostridia bacterium]